MKLEQSFEVDAPLETVWAALIDVQRVAPCLPGAELTDASDDGTYKGTFSVKIGPAKASYNGTMTMEEVDEAAHRVTMRASGTDKRGQGGAKALMQSTLTAREGGGTHVAVETDLTITGRLASFSRGGMIQDVSNRLLGEFASCLQESLAHEGDAQTGATGGAGAGGGDTTPAEATPAAASGVAGTAAPAGGTQSGGSAATGPAGGTTASGGPAQTGAAGGGAGAGGAPRPAGTSQRPVRPAKPINGLALVLGVLRDRLRRLFGRGR